MNGLVVPQEISNLTTSKNAKIVQIQCVWSMHFNSNELRVSC
jgi:hypothetical protein